MILKRIFFILLFWAVLMYPVYLGSQNCTPPPGPPPDNADENFSFNLQGVNITAFSPYLEEFPFIGILKYGNVEAMEKLLEKIGRDWIYVGKDFDPVGLVKTVNLLIIPTGGWFGVDGSSSSIFKTLLENFLNCGGHILCYAQQDSLDFQVIPVPAGENLHAVGWRNSQSCYHGSIYFSQTGPIFSGQTSQRISAGIDGGFSSFPTGTEVLIRRTTNQEPAVIAYPYGENGGMVYLSATYPDWSLAHGACTLSELKLVRDLLSYLKNPHLPIPMFDMSTNQTVQVQLNVKIKNTTEFTASKALLKTYTPFRDQVVFESEQSITLPPGEESEFPISFTLTDVQTEGLGIYGTYYELFDVDGNQVLNAVESDSGRFAIYRTPTPYVPKEQCQYWLTVDNEEVHYDDPVSFVLHARNYTDMEKQVKFSYQWNHKQIQPLTTLTLPPGETVEYSFEKEAKGAMFWVYQGFYKFGKGFTLIRPKTRSYINLNHYWGIKAGLPISYKCEVNNSLDKDIDCNIKLSLLDSKENLLKVLYNNTHHVAGGGTYEFSDTHPMPDIEVPGKCLLKLEVERPDGTKETQKTYVYYFRPAVHLSWPVLEIPGGSSPDKLIPGATYPVHINLHNTEAWYMDDNPLLQFGVDNGKLVFVFENEQGVEAGKAEISGIHIYFNEVKEFLTGITFTPPQLDVYRLKVYYQDETMPTPVACQHGTCYQSIETNPAAWFDKPLYWYLDTAVLAVKITGLGNYMITLTCPELNMTEQHTVKADPNDAVIQHFQIPIGIHTKITCQVDITGDTGYHHQLSKKIYARPFTWDTGLILDKTKYKMGEQLSGMVTLQETGGYPGVVNGEVRLYAAELGFDFSQPVSLQPGEKKQLPFNFTIPTGIDIEYSPLQLVFYASGLTLVQKSAIIYVPDALLDIAEPPKDINAGDTITLGFTNNGGKYGNFDINVQLIDNQGKEVAEFTGTIPILPGEYEEREFIVPEKIKTGEYILVQSVKDLESGKNFKEISPVNISGLIVNLNSRTLKDIYFDTDLVFGQSDIIFSSEGIDNGVLQAKIIRYMESKVVEEEEPGEFIFYNFIEAGYSSVNMLYLVTDKGVLSYDVVSGSVNVLYSFDSNPGFNCRELLFSPVGELWIASVNNGIWRQNSDGNWEHYTTADGLANNWVNDIIEVNVTTGPEIWAATDSGISVYRSGQWLNYTTTDGLPSNRVYKLSLDGSGEVWASTYGGVVKFNGTNFKSVGAPFGSTNVSDKMTATADGSVWLVAGSKLYRYQPGSGQWNTWNLIDLFPGAYTYISIYEMETINGQLWMRTNFKDSSYKYFEGMILYNGSFVDYTEKEIPGLAGLNYAPIIPGNADNDAAYFTCQFGFITFDSNTWQHKVLEIDSHKLAGTIYSMAKDKNGDLWTGTEYGLSRYDVKSKQWTNYCFTPDNQLVWKVLQVDTDGQNSVYGYFPYLDPKGGLIKIDIDNGNVETVHFPTFAFYQDEPYSINRMTVDTQGRAWFGYSYLWYYDDGEGQWYQYPGIKYNIRCMTKDLSGGIWLTAKIFQGDYLQCHLLHIKNDMTVDEYNKYNSGLLPGEKGRLYLGQEGILWITSNNYMEDEKSLQSFDGSNWIDYSNYQGFPYYGVSNMLKDDAGKLWVLDHKGNLYTLENDQFVLRHEGISYDYSLVFSNGTWYSAGIYWWDYYWYTWWYYFYPTNLLKISSTQGLIEEELWSQNYSVNLASGGTEQVDLLTGKTFTPGAYELKTALLSSLNQELASSDYGFVMKDSTLSVSLFADCSPCGFLKPGTDLGISVEVLNNTQETKSNLNFIVKKISPSETEEVVLSNTLNLGPGQLETYALTFNESTAGTWQLAAFLSDTSTGEEKESVLLFGVTEPNVTMTVLAPGYAGDESFDVKINLVNEGNIITTTQLTVQASIDGNSETPIDETIILTPGEERMLTVNDILFTKKDKTYIISLTGDVQQTETKIVKYGYIENFNINVLPLYREGVVSIGYTLANGGGLTFVDDLHVELIPVGGTVPMYIIDKSYNLYPGESPIIDALDFQLLPGNYQLRYRTSRIPEDQVSVFTVQPSGIGVVSLTGGTHPQGMKEINFQITNTDTIAGHIPVTITLTNVLNPTPLLWETRDYYLAPGETLADFINYEFIEKGNYQVVIAGAKLSVPGKALIQIVDLNEVTAGISVGAPEYGQIPVTVSIDNSGFEGFSGTVVIESGGFVHSETVEMAPSNQGQQVVTLETAGLTPGPCQVKAVIYNNRGELLTETTTPITISHPDIQVIEVPLNLEIDAGSFGTTSLKLKNQGHLWGEAQLKLNAIESLTDQREIALYPGEEIEINDIFIDVPADLPTGNYPFYYTLSGTGVENGTSAGNFNIKVNGTSLEVESSLDHSLYNPGETAVLTLNITSTTPSDASLEAVVNWGGFNETRPFNLNGGSVALVFNIPLDQEREEKVFYGIYHQEGKGIHLNDIYLNFYGAVSVETDKQVYAPGEIIHALFTGEQTGVLTVQAFEETYTLNMSGSASANFQVPVDTLGGTYGISWNFAPTDPLQPGRSGSQPFDVSGLVVKVAKSQLEEGKYVPGETINAQYIFESNRDITLGLRCWTTTPSEEWEYLGESSVTVSAANHVNAMLSYPFNTTEAGTHHLVYGLYQENRLVLSGSLAFDVGDAVLLGISPDQTEYKNGDEPVRLKIDYFGEGFAQLQVLLDEENVHQQGITLSGLGSTEVVLESSIISGGPHTIKAVLLQNNLMSTKTTDFTYGTHLPDLTALLTDTLQDGLNYSFKIEVTNIGKTASTASSLLFSDNGMNVGTAGIPALQPDQSHEVTFNWNGTGKAGSHVLTFEADNTNTIKEFSETNNHLAFTLEVPALFYTMETDPPDKFIYPANTPINIITRLINNQETTALLTLDLSITNDESGVTIHNRSKEEEIPAFASKTINDTFNTSVYPAGNYTLSQSIILPSAIRGELFVKTVPLDPLQKLLIGDGSDSADMVREISLYFEPTKIITGTLQVQPQQIPAKTPTEVTLTMTLKNAGNVPLENEILLIDVFNKDIGEVVISEELTVSIPWGEEITETKAMSLNLVEGNYEIWVKHEEEIIALSDLVAVTPIKPGLIIGIYPRVLIMNLNLSDAQQQPLQFLIGLLQSQGIEYEIGVRLLDSYVKLNKGQANVNIVPGNEMGRKLRDEIKEKVWHGEGLILLCDKPDQNPRWIDFLGVTIKPITGKTKETIIQILPNEFCSEGEIECTEKLKLQMIKEQEDVVIIAQTQQNKYPVIAYRKYGKGNILLINKSFCGGVQGGQFFQKAPPLAAGGISELLLNAIASFSLDIYTGSDLTRVLPLELSLKNESSEAKTLKIKTFLPYGVEAFDFKPEPEEGEELKWTITVPAMSTETISYWLKLPDQVNSFEIKTELYDEEIKLDELSLSFEVSQVVLYRINELILELDMIEAVGKDAQLVRKVNHHLEQIRNRTGDTFMDHLLNLHDSVKAAAYLGEVKSVDVTAQRLKTQDIMVIMGRRFYDAVKTWGEIQLNSILELLLK